MSKQSQRRRRKREREKTEFARSKEKHQSQNSEPRREHQKSELPIAPTSTTNPPANPYGEARPTKTGPNENDAVREKTWRAVGAILMVVFTGLLTVFTYQQVRWGNLQWEAMIAQNRQIDKQIQQTDQTLALMKNEQRPWIAPVAYIPKSFVDGQDVNFTLRLNNTGQTPGWIAQYDCCFSVEPTETAQADVIDKLQARPLADYERIAVPPQGGFDVSVKKMSLTQPQIELIKAGTLTLYTRGKFTYRELADINDERHQTEIVYVWDTSSGRYVAIYSHMD